MSWKLDETPSTGIASAQNIPAPNEPNAFQRALSVPAKLASHALETVGGLPGNIFGGAPKKGHAITPEEKAHYLKATGRSYDEERLKQESPEPTLAEKYLPTSADIHKLNTQFLEHYLGEGANTPQNFVEKIGQALAVTLPIAYLTGGASALVPEALATTAGSLASQGAEAAGAGPWLQTAADLTARVGLNLAKVVTNSATVKDQSKELVEHNYKVADELGKGRPIHAPETSRITNEILDKLQRGKAGILETGKTNKSGGYTNPITKQFNELVFETKNNTLDLGAAVETRKHLNNLIKDLPYGSTERKLYESVRNSINHEVIEPAKKFYPDFGEALNTADQLWKSENVQSFVRRYFDKHSDLERHMKSKVGIGLLTGSLYKGGLLGALGVEAAHLGTAKTGKYLTDALEPFIKSPVMRSLYRDIDIAVEKGLVGAIPPLVTKWDKESSKIEKQIAHSNKENRFVLD